MERVDRSDIDTSYDLDRRVLDAYEPGRSFKTVEELRDIGIVDVYVGGHETSGTHHSDFTTAVRRTRQWIEWIAMSHALADREIPENLDYLLQDDNMTEMAHRFKWRGIYFIRDGKVEEKDRYNEEVYPVFSERWEKEKREVFTKLFKQYRDEINSAADVSGKIAELQESIEQYQAALDTHLNKRRWPLYVGAAAGFLLTITALAIGAYELYLKPDIKKETTETVRIETRAIMGDVKKEVEEMIPDIPNLDEMVGRFLPVVKKEFEMYENRSTANMEATIGRILIKYGLSVEALKARLVEEMKKEMEKEMEKKKEEQEKAKDTDENSKDDDF